MTKPTKHPTDAVLTDYVSGALKPAFATVVAAHLEHCGECRDVVTGLEAIGGAMIETLQPADMDEARLIEAMSALDRPAPKAKEKTRSGDAAERAPFGPELWLAPGMGIRKARRKRGGELLYLLRLPAGTTTLPHGHCGTEFTTVLKGAYVDGELVYAAGDFCELDDSVDHQPQVVSDGECVCMIASEKPMRMTTRLGKLVQRLTGV
jgi:putative transcriptional regulator